MAKLALIGLALGLLAGGSSPKVVARVPTGASPAGAVAAFGAVWVANDAAGTLARIDPKTNRVTKRIKLSPGLFSVTRGFGALWIVNYERNTLVRVDPRSGRVRSVRVGAVPFDVAAAFGRVWVTAWEAGRLVVVEPKSLRVLRRIDVGPRPSGLRAARGSLWIGFGREATKIARLDPKTLKVERIAVGMPSPNWFVHGTRDLWVQASDKFLLEVDPVTRHVVQRISFGRTLAQGTAAADGTLWIPDKEQNRVFRVDPDSGRVLGSFAAGPGAFFALRAHGSIWVTSYAGDDVWRFRPGGP
jgi:streptogramin lyase